jgi:hypothetical protein
MSHLPLQICYSKNRVCERKRARPAALFLLRSYKPSQSRGRNHRSREPGREGTAAARPADEDPDAGIRRAKRRVRGSVETILDALRAHAEKGSCAHAKFLFDFAGIEFGVGKGSEDDSLGVILLQRLEEMQRRWREQQRGSQETAASSAGGETAPKVE